MRAFCCGFFGCCWLHFAIAAADCLVLLAADSSGVSCFRLFADVVDDLAFLFGSAYYFVQFVLLAPGVQQAKQVLQVL